MKYNTSARPPSGCRVYRFPEEDQRNGSVREKAPPVSAAEMVLGLSDSMGQSLAETMRFHILRNSLRSFLVLVAGSFCFGAAHGAALYGIGAYGDSLTPKWTTGLTLVYDDGAIRSISGSLASVDRAAATAWISSLLESPDRGDLFGADFLSNHLGYTLTREEALRRIAAAWLDSGNGEPSPESVGERRFRQRGEGRRDRVDPSQWQTICSCSYDSGDSSFTVIPVIPEPSSLLLGTLSALGLLRRRRRTRLK